MFDFSRIIDHAGSLLQDQDASRIADLADVSQMTNSPDLTQLLESAGINPGDLSGMCFEQATAVLSEAGIAPEMLNDQQAVDLVTGLLGNAPPG